MIVGKLQFARIIGKSEGSIDNYVSRGMPGYTPASAEKGTRKAAVELEVAIPWLLDYQRDELDRARTRLADEQTAKTQLYVRRMRRELVQRDDVRDVWCRLVANFRSRILGMPTKLAGILVAQRDPDVIRDRIEAEAIEALAELSDEGLFVAEQDSPRARARRTTEREAATSADDQ